MSSSIPVASRTPTRVTPVGSAGSSPQRGARAGAGKSPEYSPKQHNKLQFALSAKESQLQDLTNTYLTLATTNQSLQVAQQTLLDEKNELLKQCKLRANLVEDLQSHRRQEEISIRNDYELRRRELQVDNDSAMYELERGYGAKIDELIGSRISLLQAEQDGLCKQVGVLQQEVAQFDAKVAREVAKLQQTFEAEERELNGAMDAKMADIVRDNADTEARNAGLLRQLDTLQSEYHQFSSSVVRLEHQLDGLRASNSAEMAQLASLKLVIDEIKHSIGAKTHKISEITREISTKSQQLATFNAQLEAEELNRRKIHYTLQELKGNIRVMCRIRPLLPSEAKDQSPIAITLPTHEDELQEFSIKNNDKSYNFRFNKVFSLTANNLEIFEEVEQLIQCSIDGNNVCVFTYGQTGSGKTYTMMGENGIISQSIQHIFAEFERLKISGWEFNVVGQFLEIYNETIQDLLDGTNANNYEIRHLDNNKTEVIGVTETEVNLDNWDSLLHKVSKTRSIGFTNSNERSSRSHCIFILKLNGVNSRTGETRQGVLNFIDLAGSERINQSGVVGERLKETKSINKSLSCLKDVIIALSENNSHIPFRNSKLTYLLKNSLIGDSKTLMFVNISSNAKHFNESLNSLRFATTVNNTKLK